MRQHYAFLLEVSRIVFIDRHANFKHCFFINLRNLPAKPAEEAQKHRQQYEEMVVQAKKRGDGISCLQRRALKLRGFSKPEIHLCQSGFLLNERLAPPFKRKSIQGRGKDKSSFIKKPLLHLKNIPRTYQERIIFFKNF